MSPFDESRVSASHAEGHHHTQMVSFKFGMKSFWDTIITIAVLGGILVFSAVLTNLFTRAMYYRCPACQTLNAKRRTQCRNCQLPFVRE